MVVIIILIIGILIFIASKVSENTDNNRIANGYSKETLKARKIIEKLNKK